MPTTDPEKNRQYVAKHRAMMKAKKKPKKNDITNLMQVIMLNTQQKKKKNWELMNIIKKKPNI